MSYSYSVVYDPFTHKRYFNVTVTDKFDFTKVKNPFTQGSFIEGMLWLANDIAYLDTLCGLLDPVEVTIYVRIPVDP